MTRFVREVHPDDRLDAAAKAMGWGYPRPIYDQEADASSWVSYGGDTLVWYEAGPEPDSLAVHGCASPEARGTLGSPRAMVAMEVIAELLGASRLHVLTGSDPRTPSKAMRRYLRMRGWCESELGNYRDLGE
jgi:hypothetical protein